MHIAAAHHERLALRKTLSLATCVFVHMRVAFGLLITTAILCTKILHTSII